tara:strand:- start:770 stop:1222 length:453 start_codon:yes stop_codon:yes gene_type:complete
MTQNYKSFGEVISMFETACNDHLAINTFSYGPLDKLDASFQNVIYPYIFLRPMSSLGLQNNVRQLSFEMYSTDVPKLTESDYKGVMSDTEQYIYDIVSYFSYGTEQQDLFIDIQNITPVNEAFNDRVYGWVSTIVFNEVGVFDYCAFPQV